MTFEEVAKENRQWMVNLGYYYSGNTNLSQDLAQDAWEKAWKAWPRYKDEGKVQGWLGSILKNTYFSHVNAMEMLKRIPKPINIEGEAYEDIEGNANLSLPDCSIPWEPWEEGYSDEMEAALDSLNIFDRACMLLYDVEGLANHEIAEKLGLKLNTVKTKRHRARKAVKNYLKGYQDGRMPRLR